MGTMLNPAIYMFVKLKYETWIILQHYFSNTSSSRESIDH